MMIWPLMTDLVSESPEDILNAPASNQKITTALVPVIREFVGPSTASLQAEQGLVQGYQAATSALHCLSLAVGIVEELC